MRKVHKYNIVKDYIKTRIKNGEFLPDEKIPNESEISDILGVSSTTVKKAMTELVNEGLIYRKKGKGSYVRNIQDSQKLSPKNLVVFLLSTQNVNDSSFARIILGMQRFLTSKGYSLIVENPKDPQEELQTINKHIGDNIAGFIIYSSDPQQSIDNYIYLKSMDMPFVLLDRAVKHYPSNIVACNNHDGAFSAVQYLMELQHKRIGFVADRFHLSSEKERFDGYCDAMRFASLEVDNGLLFLDSPVDYDRLEKQIKNRNITALFVVNDLKALELMNVLTGRGIKIPGDVSVMGFDDYESSKLAHIPLSTVRQHFEEEGYYAAKILLDAAAGSGMQYNRVLIGTQLVIRSSTAILS